MIRPMLAKVFNGRNIKAPCFVQPKINGIRAIWIPNHGFFSRDLKQWNPEVLPHLVSILPGLSKLPLDGELYKHGMSLQDINSRVAVNRTKPHPNVEVIEYHVFDVIAEAPQYKRLMYLRQALPVVSSRSPLVVVPSHHIEFLEEADDLFDMYVNLGWEGIMYRDYAAPYGLEKSCGNKANRWNYLLKRKSYEDIDGTIIGVYEGDGQFEGAVGGFKVRLESGVVFNCGGGLSVTQRHLFWRHRHEMDGTAVKIRIEELSNDGVPLRARFLLIDKHELS